MSEIRTTLNSNELAAKFKENTRIADYGLSASPFFLRVSNDGKSYVLAVATIESNRKTNTSSLRDIYELDITTGEQKNKMPAQRYYSTMSQEIEEDIPTLRAGIDKSMAAEYKKKSVEILDEALEHIKEYGAISKEVYAEYLKHTLYPFSDQLADTLVKLSRTCEIETEHILVCNKCGTKLKINTASIKDGEKIFVTCTKCSNRNVANYNKKSKIIVYGKIYEAIRNAEEMSVSKEETASKNDSQLMDSSANLTVSTKATLDTQSTPQIKEITAEPLTEEQVIAEDEANIHEVEVAEEFEDLEEVEEVITEVPETTEVTEMESVEPEEAESFVEEQEAEIEIEVEDEAEEDINDFESMYSTDIIEALNKKKEAAIKNKKEENIRETKVSSDDGIVALTYHRNAFKVIKDIVNKKGGPNHVFGLKGLNGSGIDTSIRKFGEYNPSYINNDTSEGALDKCIVIDISEGFLNEWLKRKIYNLRKEQGQVIFLKGNTAQWEEFIKNEPIIASYVTSIIEYPSYNKDNLFKIFVAKMKEYGLDMCEISEEVKNEIFVSNKDYNNALKVTRLASRVYFKAMTSGNGEFTESDILKIAKQN